MSVQSGGTLFRAGSEVDKLVGLVQGEATVEVEQALQDSLPDPHEEGKIRADFGRRDDERFGAQRRDETHAAGSRRRWCSCGCARTGAEMECCRSATRWGVMCGDVVAAGALDSKLMPPVIHGPRRHRQNSGLHDATSVLSSEFGARTPWELRDEVAQRAAHKLSEVPLVDAQSSNTFCLGEPFAPPSAGMAWPACTGLFRSADCALECAVVVCVSHVCLPLQGQDVPLALAQDGGAIGCCARS